MDHLAFAAPSMDFELMAEIFMLIRIRRHDKTSQETQVSDWYRYIVLANAATKAFYTGRKPGFRVLCGSI